jgi:formiminoglutamase
LLANWSRRCLLNILGGNENTVSMDNSAALAQAVNKVLSYGCFPIILGGGREVALGHYKGHDLYYRDRKVQPNIGIINFDAHFDIRPQ